VNRTLFFSSNSGCVFNCLIKTRDLVGVSKAKKLCWVLPKYVMSGRLGFFSPSIVV